MPNKIPSELTFHVTGYPHTLTMAEESLRKFDLRGSWAMLFHSVDLVVGHRAKVMVCSPHTNPNPKEFRFREP